MNIDKDIARIAEQESLLTFTRFDEDDAWDLGSQLREMAEAEQVALTVEIRIARETVFFLAMPGTSPANADWARRKRNVVELLHKSSYGVGLAMKKGDTSLEEQMGLPSRDYATHGGAFPLRLEGVGCIGVVTASGLPQREDHRMVVAALARSLGLPLTDLALD